MCALRTPLYTAVTPAHCALLLAHHRFQEVHFASRSTLRLCVCLNSMTRMTRLCDSPGEIIHLPYPLRHRHSNLSLRILRAMRLSGILTTKPRLAFVNAFCAYSAFRGYSVKTSVPYMLRQLLDDMEECGTHDVQTDKLAATTRRFQNYLVQDVLNALNE